MLKRIDAKDLQRAVKQLARKAHIDERKAFRITNQVFRDSRLKLAAAIRGATGLPLVQARRRVRLTRGRKRAARDRWKYVALSTGGKALRIHAGRLSPKALRRKGGGVLVQNKRYPNAFFWNPKGKVLKGKDRRVYNRGKDGKIYPIAGKPLLGKVYAKIGDPLLARATARIINRMKREAMFK